MSSNGQVDLSYKPKRPPVSALPCDAFVPLDANEDVSYGQIALIDPSTGNAQLADDSTPNMIGGGTANLAETSASSAAAGTARLAVSWGCADGRAGSTVANDTPSAASIGKPAWVAGASTYGLLSHTGTVAGSNLKNRSIGGLFLGLDPDSPVGGTARPLVYEGPVAHTIARAACVADKYIGGSVAKAVDAGATTDLAETLLDNVSALHGKVSSVRFLVSGTTLPASGSTDYKTFKLWKRPASGGTPVLVASADTQTTAWTQWETVTFTLSAVAGAIDKLESDIYTITETHTGNGAVIPAGKLIVDLEVR